MPTRSTTTNFGKAWKLTIKTLPDGNGNQQVITAFSSAWLPEPLGITFEIRQSLSPIGQLGGFWFADIALFNLNTPTTNIVLKQGMIVQLEAGYQNRIGYGTIFEGTIFQPTWERIDGVTTKLTLHCIVGLVEHTNNFVSFNTAAGLTQREIIARMSQAPNMAYPLNTDNVKITTPVTQTRGAVYFNQPLPYLETIATQDTDNLWITNLAINIRKLVDPDDGSGIPTLNVSPTTGLIGTPIQTQDGVEIRINLDARAILRGIVQLSPDTQIKQLPRGQGSLPGILDANGTYRIASITHVGDSRGNVWDTYLLGFTSVGSKLGLSTP
jgi:hypothetical protein